MVPLRATASDMKAMVSTLITPSTTIITTPAIRGRVGWWPRRVVQAQRRPDARRRLVGEFVFLTQAVGDHRQHPGTLGHQGRPLRGVALEVLDRRAQGGSLPSAKASRNASLRCWVLSS